MKKAKKYVGDIDTIVGKNLKSFRVLRGITQQALAAEIGITFQQIQKYENGKSKVSASKLKSISEILNIDIEAFFEEVDPDQVVLADSSQKINNIETLGLMEAYTMLDGDQKRSLIDFLRSLNSYTGKIH